MRWSEFVNDATLATRWLGRIGRSKSRSIDGESSELEVGGVKIADLMLWEELPILAAVIIGPSLGMISISGSIDDDPRADLLL